MIDTSLFQVPRVKTSALWHLADIPPYAQYVSFYPKQNVKPERRRPRRGRITGL